MDNLTWGNPKAHRVRVSYIETSSTIYEGMPVCYNHDTTTDWSGGSHSDGAVTTSTSLTAGTPETCAAKWIEVELPSTTNQQWFAGVVAKGGWCGKTTASDSTGVMIDIYVPNGAVVPVRADISCTTFRSILCLEDSSQALTRLYSSSYTTRPVAVAMETVNRTTAGLILAKLDPNIFIQQTDPAGKLICSGAGAGDATLNSINVTEGYTSGSFCAFEIKSEHTGGSESSYGLSFMARAVVSAAATARSCAAGIRLNLTGGTQTMPLTALRVQLSANSDVIMTGIHNYGASVLNLVAQVSTTDDVKADLFNWIFIENDGTQTPDSFIYTKTAGELGDHASAGNAPAWAAGDRMIPVILGPTKYYLLAYVDSAAS